MIGYLQGCAKRPQVAGEPAWMMWCREEASRVKPASLVVSLRAVSVLRVRLSVLSRSRVTAHGHGSWSIPGERVALLHQMRPGIYIPDSHVFRKKGGWVFSWIDTVQKKPQGMDISLRQNRAFISNSQLGFLPGLIVL